MHQPADRPPPPAPPLPFQTVSPDGPMDVPPTPITNGWLAGSATARLAFLQAVDPASPVAARTVCPCVAACSNRACSDCMNELSALSSQAPHDVDTTGSASSLTIAW